MMTLASLLEPELVLLKPVASYREAAIREVGALLKGDLRVLDWEMLHQGMQKSAPCLVEQGADFGICLPHARTIAVTNLTLAIGRYSPGLPIEESGTPVRYIFCLGTPPALANDYLRIVGLLVRITKDPKAEPELHAAETPEDFIETLARLEAKL